MGGQSRVADGKDGRQDPAAAPPSDTGLLRRMLEGALAGMDRVAEAFGRYRKAAGARIAELSFALVFTQAENEILSDRLDAADGKASKEKARADDLDRDNRDKQRRIDYVDNPDTPSRHRSVAYDQRRRLLDALSPFYDDDGEVVDEAAGREGGRKKRPRGGQNGHPGASNCDATEGTFTAYDAQRCPNGHPLPRQTRTFGKRVWDVCGGWLLTLAPANGGAVSLQQEARSLVAAWRRGPGGAAAAAAAGPTGRSVCIWLNDKEYVCDTCGVSFRAGHPVSIPGTGAGRVTRGRAYAVSAELSDAKTAQNVAMFGGPRMCPGFVRNMRTAMGDSREIRGIDERAERAIAAADFHERDEVSICGDAGQGAGGGAGGAEAEEEEEAGAKGKGARRRNPGRDAPASRPSRKYVYAFMATSPGWVRVCMSPTRSRADILEKYKAYKDKYFGSDQYSGQEVSDRKHLDCLHMDRRTASCAGAGYDLLLRSGMIDGPTLYEYLRAADAWVREVLDLILSRGAGDLEAEAARGNLPVPLPPPPPATILPPRAGGGGGGGRGAGKTVQISEEKAMQCRIELLCYLAITRLFHVLKKHDTLPASAIEDLKRVVRSIVEMYGEGHRVKKSILRALPHMFTALRVPGMPMHTADVENTIRWLFSPFRESRKQLRSIRGMVTAGLQLTFIGVCRKNGVEPSEAYQLLLDDPEWDVTKHPRPPPVRRRRG